MKEEKENEDASMMTMWLIIVAMAFIVSILIMIIGQWQQQADMRDYRKCQTENMTGYGCECFNGTASCN